MQTPVASGPARRPRRAAMVVFVVVVVALGTAQRGYIYITSCERGYAASLMGDSDADYVVLANSLLTGKGLTLDGQPTAVRPIVIPALYAAYFWISHGSARVLLILRLAEYLAGALLVWALGRAAFPHRRAPRAAALALYCLVPYVAALQLTLTEVGPTIIGTLWLMRECVFLARGVRRWLMGGLAWGAAAAVAYHMRPELMCGPALIALYALVHGLRRRNFGQLAQLGIGGALLAATVALWGARNHALFGEFILGREDPSFNFWKSQHPQLEAIFPAFSVDAFDLTLPGTAAQYGDPRDPETYGRYVKPHEPVRVGKALARAVRAFYAQHPGLLLTRSLQKVWWAFFDPRWIPLYHSYQAVLMDGQGVLHIDSSQIARRPLAQRMSHALLWPPLCVLMLVGLVLTWREARVIGLVFALSMVGYLALALLGVPTTRFRAPLEPSWYPLVGLTVSYALAWRGRAARSA